MADDPSVPVADAAEPGSVPAKPGRAAVAAAPAVAVLTQPRGELLIGQLVTADPAAIDALVVAGGARLATAVEITAADTFIHDLPGA